MNLHRMLKEREALGEPLRVGLIGAGKFGSMYLSQARHTPGVRIAAIADLSPARAREALARVGWSDSAIASVRFFEDSARMIAEPRRGGVEQQEGSGRHSGWVSSAPGSRTS